MNREGHKTPPEEREPCGRAGLLSAEGSNVFFPYRRVAVDLSDCLVVRPRSFRLVIWEPLRTKAPAPPKAQPFCCFIQTVIFYHSPYIVRPWSRIWQANGKFSACTGGFEEWDKIETRLAWDDLVTFEDELFRIGSGHVLWARRRWWMLRHARRHVPEKRPAA